MKTLILFVTWCILFVLSWPLALLVLLVAPVVWLISIPFRLLGACVSATLALVKSILMLPARILGYQPCRPALPEPRS